MQLHIGDDFRRDRAFVKIRYTLVRNTAISTPHIGIF